jgi:hypothetical protein
LCDWAVTVFSVFEAPENSHVRHIHKASLYVRQRNTQGKYAFVCVEGQGRKPTSGRFYVRHTNEQGKQKWVPLAEDLDYKKAVQERDAFAAGLHATRHGLTVAEMGASFSARRRRGPATATVPFWWTPRSRRSR